jgi:hypothetical protein
MIVISFSGVGPKTPPLDISGILTTTPITILASPKPLLAGANRNAAAAKAVALGANILSFFDADDLMHPRRLELIEKAFTEHPEITGFIHHFIVGPKLDRAVYEGQREIPWEPITMDFLRNPYTIGQYNKLNLIKFQRCYAKSSRRGYGMGANGHLTVRAPFWEQNPYLETVGKGEDNHFSAGILAKKEFLAYTGDTLSCYMRADFKQFQTGL